MSNLVYVAIACVVGALLWVFRSRLPISSRSPRVLLVILLDNGLTRAVWCKPVAEGLQSLSNKAIYPAADLHRAVQTEDGRLRVYVMGADHIALATHESLEAGRLSLVPRMMFKSGGDFARTLQFLAPLISLGVALWMGSQLGTFQTSITKTAQDIAVVRAMIDKGLEVKVKP